eukprot:1874770-Rhodomonas_salina.2
MLTARASASGFSSSMTVVGDSATGNLNPGRGPSGRRRSESELQVEPTGRRSRASGCVSASESPRARARPIQLENRTGPSSLSPSAHRRAGGSPDRASTGPPRARHSSSVNVIMAAGLGLGELPLHRESHCDPARGRAAGALQVQVDASHHDGASASDATATWNLTPAPPNLL